jgi:hypothetical protein
LATWHPEGVVDDDSVDRLVGFLESEEAVALGPFNRFADLTGITRIQLKFGHAFRIAQRRRAYYPWREPIKSAFFCDWAIGYGFARMYEALMAGGPIHVRAFRSRKESAEWLEVPLGILLPEAKVV